MKNLALSLFVFWVIGMGQAFANVVVIVHPSNNHALSHEDISRAFLGKLKKFPDGQVVKAINATSQNKSRKVFEQKVLKKTSAQIKAYWSKQLFSGKAKPLKELSSDEEIVKYVSANPNTIAYVSGDIDHSAVKVVTAIK